MAEFIRAIWDFVTVTPITFFIIAGVLNRHLKRKRR